MPITRLITRAQQVVKRVQQKLPAEIRDLALAVPVNFHDWPNEELLGNEFESDILGLFVGDHRGIDVGVGNPVPPQIFLFLENIYDEAESDLARFDKEVRLTYLHELGHYFGWDENEVESRGL